MNLEQKIARGFFWEVLGKVFQRLIMFFTTIVLARLLMPKDFGTIAIAIIFIQFLRLIESVGISEAIIQRNDIDDGWLPTAFFISIFVGMFFFISVFIFADFMGKSFNDCYLTIMLRILSFIFIIEPASLIPQIILYKKMDFKKIIFLRLVSVFMSSTVVIMLALLNYGVISFAWGVLAGSLTDCMLSWIIMPWRPRLYFDRKKAKVFLNWGLNIVGAKIALYIRSNVDYFIVARFLGMISLGYYSLASKLPRSFYSEMSTVVFEVLFPAVSKVNDDNDVMRKYYLKVIMYLALISFPLYLGLFILSKQFILFAYGPKWGLSVAPLRIFCILGLFTFFSKGPAAVTFYSKGRGDLVLKFSVFYLVIDIIAIIVGIPYGIIGIASSLTIAEIINFALTVCIGNYLIHISWMQYLRNLSPIIISSIVMSFFLLLSTTFVKQNIMSFFTNIIVAVGIYFICLRILGINIAKEITTAYRLLSIGKWRGIKGYNR